MDCWQCKTELKLLDRGNVIECPKCHIRWTHFSSKAVNGYDTKFEFTKYNAPLGREAKCNT